MSDKTQKTQGTGRAAPEKAPDAAEQTTAGIVPLFVNRELSWLEFNRRVLLEALDETVPLLERLKFVAIYGSNLDEFFMVRVGSLTDQCQIAPAQIDDKTGMNAAEQIAAIGEWVETARPLCEKAYHSMRKQLKGQGIDLLDFGKLSKMEEIMAQKHFKEDIKSLLSPQVVDRHHPFPFLRNKEQYVMTSFATKNGEIKLGIVPVSSLPPYFIFSVDNRQKVMFTADIVLHFAQDLYSKYEITERFLLRVTRNADISVDEGLYDYDVDFRGIMQELLKKRKRLRVVRVQLSRAPSETMRKYLSQKLSVQPAHIHVNTIPLDLSFGFSLAKELPVQHRELLYQDLKPVLPAAVGTRPVMKCLPEGDILLAYPFHGMNTFINLLHEAAEDPAVVSIKISLYRLANHSRVVSALAYAAERGKQILCVLELRARFDEQNNIDYAKILEDAGCTVIYGLSDFKIHAKLCLITRMAHNGRIGYVTQVGTGNYNEKTAELYTDLAYITSDDSVGRDASDIFSALCVGETVDSTRTLWAAPNCYLSNLLALIDKEIEMQRAGGEGFISIKVNSLNDMEVQQKLIEASQAGVRVELFVRGICCIRPGVRGYTDNITVRSVVGRYLEHSRIFVFGTGARQMIYIGSGDLLNRNTRRRVEVFVRVRSGRARADILRIMAAFRKDNVKAWNMLPDGTYYKPERGDARMLDSQAYLFDYFARAPRREPAKPDVASRLLESLRHIGNKIRPR